MNQSNLIMQPHERPQKKFKWVVLSLQHLFAMFGATILVPYLTGLDVSTALLASGCGTLIYIACTKAKVPIYLGSSFAYIGVIIAVSGFERDSVTGAVINAGSYGSVMTAFFIVGIIYIILSVIIRFFGSKWMDKVFPPVVIGSAIMIIGLSLASVAITNMNLNESAGNIFSNNNWKAVTTGILAFVIVVFVSLKAKGFLKLIPFLIAIIGGYIYSAIIGGVDFTTVAETIKNPAKWFTLPQLMFLGWGDGQAQVLGSTISFHQINFAAVLTIAPLAFVTACEHIGDHAVLGKICDKDFLKDPGLKSTLLGAGIATSFASLLGGPPSTTYGENTSVIGMTKIGSVWVTGLAAIFAIILSFCNLFTVIISSVPSAVMGGMSIILYGFISANGLRVIYDSKVDLYDVKNIIIISSMLVIGLGGTVLAFTDSIMITSMALAVVVGVILNFALFGFKDKKLKIEQ